jgi:hypothetical protein
MGFNEPNLCLQGKIGEHRKESCGGKKQAGDDEQPEKYGSERKASKDLGQRACQRPERSRFFDKKGVFLGPEDQDYG